MKKRLFLMVSVLALLAVTAMPALAAGGQCNKRWLGDSFALVGEVTAVDAETGSITVEVYTGNALVKDYIGEELVIATDAETMFLRYGELTCEVIAFEDVEVGAYVSINGHLLVDAGVETFLAKRVTVDVPLHSQE